MATTLLFTAAVLASSHSGSDRAPGGAEAARVSSVSSSTAGEVAGPEVPPYTVALGLGGYSPVSYLEKNRAEPGSPRYTAEHDGVTYLFTSSAQVKAFEADPERYLPAYGGYCAFGCSVDSKFIPDPTSFRVINGRTHLFLKNADVDAKKLWEGADAAEVKAKADQFWASQGERSKAYLHGRNVPASGLGLEGYSPVSYFTVGRPEKGDARFAVEHHGVTYHLTSAEQVELFKKNPDKYEPQCGGWCAFGMSVEDKFPVDPTKYKVIDDQLYLFLNNEEINAMELWEKGNQKELTGKARAHWKEVSGG